VGVDEVAGQLATAADEHDAPVLARFEVAARERVGAVERARLGGRDRPFERGHGRDVVRPAGHHLEVVGVGWGETRERRRRDRGPRVGAGELEPGGTVDRAGQREQRRDRLTPVQRLFQTGPQQLRAHPLPPHLRRDRDRGDAGHGDAPPAEPLAEVPRAEVADHPPVHLGDETAVVGDPRPLRVHRGPDPRGERAHREDVDRLGVVGREGADVHGHGALRLRVRRSTAR
jgi:hypothetical protein